MTALVRNIPPSLWREFKAACAADGRTLNQAIIDLISEYLRRRAEEIAITSRWG